MYKFLYRGRAATQTNLNIVATAASHAARGRDLPHRRTHYHHSRLNRIPSAQTAQTASACHDEDEEGEESKEVELHALESKYTCNVGTIKLKQANEIAIPATPAPPATQPSSASTPTLLAATTRLTW